MDISLKKRIGHAARWSIVTEIATKLVAPITTMILARLLTPEAFGVVTTITMIISFTDMFTDAGFQKYLIQHEFDSIENQNKSTTVAFWTNFSISLFLWGIVIFFRNPISTMVGNPGLGNVLAIACLSLPLTSFVGIQTALFRRNLDFKTLFYVRILNACIPLFVTIPIAMVIHSYWALIIGTIFTNLSNAVVLTYYSKWKPRLFYSFSLLKDMLNFSVWALLEQLIGWMNLYIGIFIVGAFLSSYYLGIYKTSMGIVNQILALITGAISPVLFSGLCRLFNNRDAFNDMFFRFTRLTGLIALPIGVGIFVYRDFITNVLLGNQWIDAAGFISIWGLTRAFRISYGFFSNDVFLSLGKPRFSVLSQLLEMIILVPVLIISLSYGFEILCIARSMTQIVAILVDLMLLRLVAGLSAIRILKDSLPALIAAFSMGIFASYLNLFSENFFWNLISIFLCIILYFTIIIMFPKSRNELLDLISFCKRKV